MRARIFLDPGEAAGFMDELRRREPVVADAVEVGLLTALRKSNVLKMKWSWCSFPPPKGGHLAGGSITVPGLATKNGDPVTLPLVGRLLAVLDRRWQERREGCPFVFHRAGRRVVTFEESWDAAAAAIGRGGRDADGKRRLRFHDLRRSAARILRRAGVDQVTIMARAGWKTSAMFERYGITDQRDQLDAQRAMDAALTSTTVAPLPRPASTGD